MEPCKAHADGRHRPEWRSLQTAEQRGDEAAIIDVWCRCGVSGSTLLEPIMIQWE